jgi:hypothetical protein
MAKYGAGHGIRTRDIQLGKLASDSVRSGFSDVRAGKGWPEVVAFGPCLDIAGWEEGWES